MDDHLNSIGLQGLKPLFYRPLNVAAEAATHKETTHKETADKDY